MVTCWDDERCLVMVMSDDATGCGLDVGGLGQDAKGFAADDDER